VSIKCGENQTFFSQTKNRTVELFEKYTMSRKYILDMQSFTEYIPAKFYEKHSWIRWQETVTARNDQTPQRLFNRFKLCIR